MPSIESIQSRLTEIDASTFQRLGDDYFTLCSEIKYKEIKPIGLSPGKRAPKTGTPDTLIILENEKYILVEYTTKKRNEKKSEYIKKLKDDLIKCQNPKKTGIQLKDVRQIILASSHLITIKDRKEILSVLKSKHTTVTFCDLDFWAKEIRRNSFLASNYLNLPLESNQVLGIEEFIREYERGGISTPLSNKFLHRSSELQAAESSIKENVVYVLSGPPGVGKTKLALEAITKHKTEHPDTLVLCLKDKGSFTLDDIRTHFFQHKSYLIFIDDANRCARILDLVINSILEGMTIRLVLTVREYAQHEIESVLIRFKPKIDKIKPFEDNEIIDILRTVANFSRSAINKILSIALGNPRIALMAARVANETQTLKSIANATEIFDQYFGNIVKDKQTFSAVEHLKCLGILSVFRAIDLSSDEANRILQSFQISSHEFWESANELEDIEFVEIDGDLIRITEQNLQAYSFYKAFLLEKRLSIATLLNDFFSKHSNRIKDIIVSANNTFDYENIREKTISSLLNRLKLIKDEGEKILFLECFWFYCPNQTFQFAKRHIENLPFETSEEQEKIDSIHLTSKHFRLLIHFLDYNNENFLPALELLIEFVKRSPNHFQQLVEIVNGRLTYSEDSYPKYQKQEKYLKLLVKHWNKDQLYRRLFVSTANQFLYSKFTISVPTHKRNSISLAQHSAPLNASLKKQRKLIWSQINEKFESNPFEFTRIVTHYAEYRIDLIKTFVSYDAPFLSKIVLNKYDPSNLVQLLGAARVRELVSKLRIGTNLGSEIKTRLLSSKLYKHYTILSWNHDPLRLEYKGDYEKFAEYKSKLVIDSFNHLPIDEVEQLVNDVHTWCPQIGDHYSNGILASIDILGNHFISTTDIPKAWKILDVVTQAENSLNFVPYRVIESISRMPELHEPYLAFFNKYKFRSEVTWFGTFISGLPEDRVLENHKELLQRLIARQNQRFYFDFAWITSLCKTFEESPRDLLTQFLKMWRKSEIQVSFPREFFIESEHLNIPNDLLEDAYIMQYLINDTFDFRGESFKVLIEKDDRFLIKFCRAVFGVKEFRGSKDASFIKGLIGHPRLEILATQFLDYLSANSHLYSADFYTVLKEVFAGSNLDFKGFVVGYLSKNARKISKAKIVMETVDEVWSGHVTEFLRIFLKHNSKLDDFKKMNWSMTGGFFAARTNISEIYLSKWKAIENVMKEFESVKYLEHKLFVEEMVQYSEQRALQESKELFLKRSFYDD
jgi:hypothetical protein